MTKSVLLCTSLAAMFVDLLLPAPAQALLQLTFASSAGSGTTCTRAAPCTLQGAHDQTSPGGQVNCVPESTSFSFITIFKSITIDCNATFFGFLITGADIEVILRNMTIDGGFVENVIDFANGASLTVDHCIITDTKNLSPFTGIRFRPSTAAKLMVTDTIVAHNGNGTTGGGIVVSPQAGGTAQVVLNRVIANKNAFGLVADGTGSTGGINMTITDSVSSNNTQDGIIAVTPGGGAPIGVYVKNTKSANNNIGIRSIGSNVTVRVDGSSVIGNSTGLSFSAGGALLTAGNNMIQANGANGAFSGTVGLQ